MEKRNNMEKSFVYGMSVEGENFTDRVHETKRLKMRYWLNVLDSSTNS